MICCLQFYGLYIHCIFLVGEETFLFVEQPPADFFCPVTTDLLLQPHLTSCCGNYLSEEAIKTKKSMSPLQRSGMENNVEQTLSASSELTACVLSS